MKERPFIAVYMMANRRHGTIYTGVSSDLPYRVRLHRAGAYDGFTKKYGLKRLVWFEPHATIVEAIQREKQIKKYRRDWKINLIERQNPEWIDLYEYLASGSVDMGGRDTLPPAQGRRPGCPAMTDQGEIG